MVQPARRVAELFQQRFGRAPSRIHRAPGRVNLIGEHTDYNGGLVLPIAIDRSCWVASAPNDDGVLRVWAADVEDQREWPVNAISAARAERGWTSYVLGVAQCLGREVPALDLAIHSDVPIGAGLSSSAALEVSTALALLDGRAIDPLELALLCHRAENEVAGLPCGTMDQMISVFGQEGSALLIDCRDNTHRPVRLPDGLLLVVVNSMVKHELAGSAYADRVRECRAAAAHLGVEHLRDVPVEAWRGLSGVPLKRARHAVSESQRVESFVEASERGDAIRMGQLMVASHNSLQRDYEVSCAELDFLAASAISVQGVLGARMTGGGFGGCTVNLMVPSAESAFRDRINASYEANFGRAPDIWICRPSAGAARE